MYGGTFRELRDSESPATELKYELEGIGVAIPERGEAREEDQRERQARLKRDAKQREHEQKAIERRAALVKIREAHPWIQRMPPDRSVPAQRAMLHTTRAFGFVELLVPKRLSSEEIGDAMELIIARLKGPEPVWHVYVKVATTILWILLNTVRHVMRGSGSGAKKSDT